MSMQFKSDIYRFASNHLAIPYNWTTEQLVPIHTCASWKKHYFFYLKQISLLYANKHPNPREEMQ